MKTTKGEITFVGPLLVERGAVFEDNERLWTRELRRLGIRLSAERDTRPGEKTLTGAFADSAAALPSRVASVVTGAAHAAEEAGKEAVGAMRGALDDLK